MTESTPAQPQTMRLQGLANRVVRGLLATPVAGRGIGARLITIYVVGRTSGRRFSVPVAYTHHGDALLVGTPFGWGKNLQTRTPVDIRLRGSRRTAEVEAFCDEETVVAHYAEICRRNAQFARFNNIGIGADGTPDAEDLHRAWQAGARSFLLRPR
ncbi:hypothetical protein QSJ19_18880 [Gordonia sp. ABSL11-1]|uniref:hypothetical protein n=1 Tax=Gordonia sp. ABSL11-1 TaxID=3053924 RepID=UPI00257446D5|nr:hypothetical protein [Gordonia sp. ABSL11-1]MDL9947609.1 hypothetical protein [Gordonia sp. ABSL11-1]